MNASLTERIRQFYDQSSHLWEEVWGEHMHHGYYGPEGGRRCDRTQAQVDLIEALLDWGQVQQASQILDVGCGIGGSSLYLANQFGARVTGITLSPVQAARATARAEAAGMSSGTEFRVADALQLPFPDQCFDLVWSLESGEHMPDKRAFLQECYRVLQPGGRLLVATWCHRPCQAPQPPLSPQETNLLAKIYRVYHLPYIISLPEYAQIAQELGFEQIRTADWSDAVAPFWQEVIVSAVSPAVIWKILGAGWDTLQGALALRFMSQGYRQGLLRYGVLYAQR